MTVKHKHLIIRAEVNNAPTAEQGTSTQGLKASWYLEHWVRALVDSIGMKLIKDVSPNPIIGYVAKKGNSGFTILAMIESSHISIHIWD